MVGKFLPPQIGSFTKIPAEEADQFFSQHPIIYRPTHRKNRTPTGGVSGLPLLFPLAEDLSQTIEKIFLSSTGMICQ